MTEKKFEEFIESCELELEESYCKDNQLITPYHTLFKYTFTFPNGKSYTGEYQCNTAYCYPDKSSVLECLIFDAISYNDYTDMAQFLYEYGYTENVKSLRKGIDAYEACKQTYEFFKSMDDINIFELLDCFNDNFDADEQEDEENDD